MESLSTTMTARQRLIAVVVCAWLLAACTDGRSPECKSFLALSTTERQIESRKYSPDKQIDLYLCAMKQEPPDLELANQLSDRGEEAIPLLRERLKDAKSEVDQHDLIYVFELMSRKGHLRGKTQLVAEISDVVDAMTIAPVKEDTRDILKRIRINSRIKPFTYVQ